MNDNKTAFYRISMVSSVLSLAISIIGLGIITYSTFQYEHGGDRFVVWAVLTAILSLSLALVGRIVSRW